MELMYFVMGVLQHINSDMTPEEAIADPYFSALLHTMHDYYTAQASNKATVSGGIDGLTFTVDVRSVYSRYSVELSPYRRLKSI